MRKLTLQVEELKVDSFTAQAADGPAGTVHAHELAPPTREYTCQWTCANSTCTLNC